MILRNLFTKIAKTPARAAATLVHDVAVVQLPRRTTNGTASNSLQILCSAHDHIFPNVESSSLECGWIEGIWREGKLFRREKVKLANIRTKVEFYERLGKMTKNKACQSSSGSVHTFCLKLFFPRYMYLSYHFTLTLSMTGNNFWKQHQRILNFGHCPRAV